MKKKNLSFMTLFMLTASLVGGCSCNKQSNENVSNLVIKVGDKEYSAKDLYNELLSTGTGANEAFAKVLRLVVESAMDTTPNIQAAADLAAENFETEVENDSITNGTSKDDSRKKLLEEKGYSSVDEMKADIIYEEKLERVTQNFWETRKTGYFERYMEARLPYLVRHVLVKIDDTNGNKIANNVSISQSDGEKLYDVIKRFESGDKFSYVANQESEDTGSTATGGAYYMDNTYGVNGFVDEFVYGTYAFDAYTTKSVEDGKTVYTFGADEEKVSKLTGLNDTETFAKYYENGFNFVDMTYVNALGDVYNQTTLANKDYFNIGVVNKVEEEGKEPTYESASGNLNSSENAYARSIIFNRVFNKTGVSVIGYNSESEIPESVKDNGNYVELKMSDTESKYILTDEKGHPIFFVAARGSGNAIWVHFLTINVSSLDNLEEAKKFFSLNPNDQDESYVKLMNTAGTSTGRNTVISELESYVKSYATYGTGNAVGEESILNYDMVEYYMGNSITFVNKELETAVKSYIANRKKFLETKLLNSMSDDWDTHTDKLASNMSTFVKQGIKPFECGVYLASGVESKDDPYTALTTSDYLCRYVYGEGYQVQLAYYYQSNSSGSSETFTKISKSSSNRAYFVDPEVGDLDQTKYVQYVTIGAENSEHILLPTPKVASGYQFEGWFTDKGLTKEVAKDNQDRYYIDLSESRITNKTIFFAKVTAIEATTINYIYQYSNGDVISSDVEVTDTGLIKSKTWVENGENTIALDTANASSEKVTIEGFYSDEDLTQKITDLTITQADQKKTINVYVKVSPKASQIIYRFVDSSSKAEVDAPHTNTNPTTATYDPANKTAEVAVTASNFDWVGGSVEDYSATGTYKVYRLGENETEPPVFTEIDEEDLEDSVVLTEADMNDKVIVYVFVDTTTGGN